MGAKAIEQPSYGGSPLPVRKAFQSVLSSCMSLLRKKPSCNGLLVKKIVRASLLPQLS